MELYICLSDRSLGEFAQQTTTGACIERLCYFFPGLQGRAFYGTELFKPVVPRKNAIMGVSPDEFQFFAYWFDDDSEGGKMYALRKQEDQDAMVHLPGALQRYLKGTVLLCENGKTEEVPLTGPKILLIDRSTRFFPPLVLRCRQIIRAFDNENHSRTQLTTLSQAGVTEIPDYDSLPLDDRL